MHIQYSFICFIYMQIIQKFLYYYDIKTRFMVMKILQF